MRGGRHIRQTRIFFIGGNPRRKGRRGPRSKTVRVAGARGGVKVEELLRRQAELRGELAEIRAAGFRGNRERERKIVSLLGDIGNKLK